MHNYANTQRMWSTEYRYYKEIICCLLFKSLQYIIVIIRHLNIQDTLPSTLKISLLVLDNSSNDYNFHVNFPIISHQMKLMHF